MQRWLTSGSVTKWGNLHYGLWEIFYRCPRSKSTYRLIIWISRSEVIDFAVAQNSHFQKLCPLNCNSAAHSRFKRSLPQFQRLRFLWFLLHVWFLAVFVSDMRLRLRPSCSECFYHTDWMIYIYVIFSLGKACIICDLDSTSETKWPSHYTIYHRKLSNAGLVSAVGIRPQFTPLSAVGIRPKR